MTITAADIWAIFVVLVIGSTLAAFIVTWWERRQRDKEKKGGK